MTILVLVFVATDDAGYIVVNNDYDDDCELFL